MVTYLVLDLKNKTHYVGSSTGVKRPYCHLKSPENFHLKRAKRHHHPMWVFISADDGLDTRDEEQYYLDFYIGSRWSMNINPDASANPEALVEYNRKVREGALPASNLGGSWRGPADINEQRVSNGSHNFLAENRDPEVEQRRVKAVKEALSKSNPSALGVEALRNLKWEDPDHPELGQHHYNRLSKLQRQHGYPCGKENRVKVKC